MESTPTTTNPLGSDAGSNGGRSELEGALKGLQDGSLSDQEAAAVMERMMDARVSDLRTERFELSGRPHRDLIWTRHRGHHLLRLCHRGAQRRRWCL
jgi:hypothetical protein